MPMKVTYDLQELQAIKMVLTELLEQSKFFTTIEAYEAIKEYGLKIGIKL